MRCPVCKEKRTIFKQLEYGGPLVEVPAPLYQVSYPGSKEYVPPRCSECYDKTLEKRKRKRNAL